MWHGNAKSLKTTVLKRLEEDSPRLQENGLATAPNGKKSMSTWDMAEETNKDVVEFLKKVEQ